MAFVPQPRPDELAQLRERVEALARELADVRERLADLEGAATAARTGDEGRSAVDVSKPMPVGELLPLAGRVFLILGGAFLVRALTEAGALSAGHGVAFGFAYASAWIVAAERARRRRRLESSAYLLAATLMGFPLLWEACIRFGVLSTVGAAVALGLLTHLLLVIVRATRLPVLAWIVTVAAAVTTGSLFLATHAVVPLTILALILGATTAWLARTPGLTGLGWPAALVADLMVLAALFVASRGSVPDSFPRLALASVILLALALPITYLLVFALSTRAPEEAAFEAVQVGLALAIGYGGAVQAMRSAGTGAPLLGALGTLLGGAAYALRLRRSRARDAGGIRGEPGALLALAALLYGSSVWLGAPSFLLWLALGVTLCRTGASLARSALVAHGTFVLVAAAIQTGIVLSTLRTYTAAVTPLPRGLAGPALLVLLSALAARVGGTRQGAPSQAVSLALTFLALSGAVTLAVVGLEAAVGRSDPARLAMARTAVLAAAALGLGTIARAGRAFAPAWLAYAVLAAGALKLLVQDLPQGRPATLFVGFALYGAALIAVPRLTRGAQPGRASART